MEDYKLQIEKLESDLKLANNKIAGFSSAFEERTNFQLSNPLDPFTRNLIIGVINDQTSGGTYITSTSTSTLTNKRITKRVGTTTSTSTLTIDSDSYDMYTVTALAGALTIAAPTGTPTVGQSLIVRLKDNATARALTWNSIFRASSTLALPTTTVISKTLYCGFIYNTTDSKWDMLAYLDNF